MNIYTILMSRDKCDINLPHISNSVRKTSQIVKKDRNLLKEAKNFSMEHSHRKTYHEILKSNQLTQLTRKKEEQKQKTIYKRTYNTTFIKLPNNSKSQFPILTGFKFVKEIGKGGFAEVFLYENLENQKFAVKEYQLNNSLTCYQNETMIGEHFFEDGKIRKEFAGKRGSDNLIAYVKKNRIGKKGYIFQEMGGRPLAKLAQDIQGIFFKGERVYQIVFSQFYLSLPKNGLLKAILIQIMGAIQLFNKEGFLHCDLKPDNILVDWSEGEAKCKIIDYGSSFERRGILPKITITPEYMPPQLLETIELDLQMPNLQKVDIWSFGCILLQLLTGIPLWFRYKCKLTVQGKDMLNLSYFALTNREYLKIVKKQKEICQNINKLNFVFPQFEGYRKILKRILVFDVEKRASHREIIDMLEKL